MSGDRDKSGKFTPGHKIKSPGNPQVRRLAEHRAAIGKAITGEDLIAALKKLKALALSGDVLAIKTLLGYCIGRPAEASGAAVGLVPANSFEDCRKNAQTVQAAIAAGTVSVGQGSLLIAAVREARETFRDENLDARLSALEMRDVPHDERSGTSIKVVHDRPVL